MVASATAETAEIECAVQYSIVIQLKQVLGPRSTFPESLLLQRSTRELPRRVSTIVASGVKAVGSPP